MSVWKVGQGWRAVVALMAVTAAVLLFGVGAAVAAGPIDLGQTTSSGPSLALTPAGSAALAYATSEGSSEALHYCRIDPGAGGCSAATTFANPAAAFNEDLGFAALADGSAVRVIESRRKSGAEEDKFLWSGEPFGAATALGTSAGSPGYYLRFGQALLAPAGTLNPSSPVIATIETGPVTSGPYLAASTIAAGGGPPSNFRITTDSVGDSTLGVGGPLLLAAWSDQTQDNGIFWRRYTGSGGTPASIQNGANWSPAAPAAAGNGASPEVRIASGPSGLFLAHIRPSDDAVVIQQFTGLGFGTETAVTSGGTFEFAISEDAGGVLHLAWNGSQGAFYRYGKDPSNAAFSNPQTLPDSDYRDMQIATTAAGSGWLTWWDADSTHSFADPLAPGEPTTPTPAPAPVAPSPSGGTPKGGSGPTKGGSAPTKTVSESLGHGLLGTLTVPRQCVAGGSIFKAKVAVKRKGSVAHKASYTVKQVAFLLAGKRISTDKRKPFEVGFATKGIGSGKTLSVDARISVALHLRHRSSTVNKTLATTVKTCG